MLSEGIADPAPAFPFVSEPLTPKTPFEDRWVQARLPEPKAFGLRDLRCGGCLVGKSAA